MMIVDIINRIFNMGKCIQKIVPQKAVWKDITFWRPKNTKVCPDGYKGRIGLYEVLSVSEAIKELIIKEASSDAIQGQAIKEGMRTMVEDGFVKAAQGVTSIEEVLRVISE